MGIKSYYRHLCSFTRLYTTKQVSKCLKLNSYAQTISQLQPEFFTPSLLDVPLKPNEALVEVHAASVNPFDIEMTRGYGRNAINIFRGFKKLPEFPLILGRDCSGVIVKRGNQFHRFHVNDEVSCVRWIIGQGTHAQHVIVSKYEVSLKPQNLNFIEAASIPYVACTTWSALIDSGALPIQSKQPRRIFIPGGTGGVGSFALQLCKYFGHDVTTSCSPDGKKLMNSLGINTVLDYTVDTFEDDLQSVGPFDFILDTVNEKYFELFQKNLKKDIHSRYISLRPTLLPNLDKQGIFNGFIESSINYFSTFMVQIVSGRGQYVWGFFKPNALILDKVKPIIEEGKIKPVIDKVFSIDEIIDAYRHVEHGHARGKTVVDMLS